MDFLEEVRLIKPCCEKIYYLHTNGTKVQNNYYKSFRAVLSALHMIAIARYLNPCLELGVYTKENLPIYMEIRDRSLFKCQGGGGLKVGTGGGGHVNFHVVSRGVAFNFDFPVGGVMLI